VCKRQICSVVLVLLLGCGMVAQADIGDGLVGLWQFSNPDDLTAAAIGNDLVLAGDGVHTAIAGVDAGDGAVSIGVGSYYECFAGIAANGGGSMVNQYTLLFDFRYPSSSVGQYMCFFQTDTTNSNDGDYFISPSEDWGVASITYASNAGGAFSVPDTWYRVIMSVDQGSGDQFFGLYIDGVLIHTHGNSGTDGRHSLFPDPDVTVLLFADENGEDPDVHCSTIAIWDRSLTAEEIAVLGGAGDTIVLFGPSSAPNPEDGAIDVLRDVALTWTPGEFAATHDVYLGTSLDDVNTAERTDPLGVLVSQGQADVVYDPEGLLEFGQTYYWRVDEVNAAPDNTIFRGEVWSFTAEPFAYPVANVTATSNADSTAGPENTVNGSGLNDDDQHSTSSADMWLANPADGEPTWIQYDLGQVYKLYQMLVWNYNAEFELLLGFGLKDVTVEYSTDGVEWTALGDVELAQATAKSDYAANTTLDFDGVAAQHVRLTVNGGWGVMGQYGLSEVRFLQIPAQAREPQPADGAADVALATELTWRAGREAESHQVYVSADQAAVTDGTAPVETVATNSFAATGLEFGMDYYWRVDEVNEADEISVWPGKTWTFVTQEYAAIDDFEAYDDDENRIYDTWLDGWVNNTGSTVGYLEEPFAEQRIVFDGTQSMPLEYRNDVTPFYSEAERDLGGMNLTGNGADTLFVHFRGSAAATEDQAGNDPAPVYVAVEDNAGNVATVAHSDPEATVLTEWQVWPIPFSELGGVNLNNVSMIYIGVGDRDNPSAGGAGTIYVDDVGYGRPYVGQ